jgi:FkbM family methyltransferase
MRRQPSATGMKPKLIPSFKLAAEAYTRRNYREAIALCQAATEKGGDARWWSLRGAAERDGGEPAAAEQSLLKALALDPGNIDACANLGLILADLGRVAEGVERERQAVAINPKHAGARANLGTLLLRIGDIEAARAEFHAMARLKPSAAAVRGLAECCKRQGDVQGALALYRDWLRKHPDDVEVLAELGTTLVGLQRWNEARVALERARELAPASFTVLANLGTVYRTMYKHALALETWTEALRLKPDSPELRVNLGALYKDLGRSREAETTLLEAIALRPGYANAHNNLGSVYRNDGRAAEARDQFAQAIRLEPTHWGAWSNLLFVSQNIADLDPSALEADHRHFGQAVRAAGIEPRRAHGNTPEPERILRVGLVSPDFKSHSVSYFIAGFLQHHDRRQVHVICYANQSAIDPRTELLQAWADGWHFVPELTDEQLADLVERDGIDVLIDLAGHTAGNRLLTFARRPAPVQVTWIGYPDTTGLDTIDYRITDAWADPPGLTEAHHTETLVRLDRGFLCFSPPETAPPPADPPCIRRGHVTFGSFNSLSKIDPVTVRLWSAILRRLPDSRLVLKSLAFDDEGSREHYTRQFASHGIAASRLTLLGKIPSQEAHLAAYADIDIALDCYPYHGTTTTCESLWMGVPVVTLAGRRHVSRVGVSLLSQVGHRELIADDEEAYIALAVAWATDPQRQARFRQRIREEMAASPLCDAERHAIDVETTLRNAWRKWCATQGEGFVNACQAIRDECPPATPATTRTSSAGAPKTTIQENPTMSQQFLEIKIPLGVSVSVPDDMSLMTPYVLLEQGDWFEDEIRFIRHLIEPDTSVVDIGANYGVYTLTFAKLVGPRGRIWAFEPASKTADFLQRSLQENGFSHVDLIRAALSDHEGEARLSTHANAELNTLHGQSETSEVVRLTTLDSMMDTFSKRDIAFVKLDAEGEEPAVIGGGGRFFAEKSPLVMFEIKHGTALNLALVQRFGQIGYSSYRLIPGLGILVPFQPSEPVDSFQLNLFACKPDRARALAAKGLLVSQVDSKAVHQGTVRDAWLTLLRSKVWANGLLPDWQKFASAEVPAGFQKYRNVLNAYAQSADPGASPKIRTAALVHAYRSLRELLEKEGSLSRLCSLARIASDLGQRAIAVKVLQKVQAILQKGGAFDLSEPFIPVSARFDDIEPASRLGHWMLGSVIEALEKLSSYSSYFSSEKSVQLLNVAAGLTFTADEAKRRLDLIKRRKHTMERARVIERSLLRILPRPATAVNVVDIGAMDLGEERATYQPLLDQGLAIVTGFEPNEAECAKLSSTFGSAHRFYPFFIGNGGAARYYETSLTMTGSLFRPNKALVEHFTNLSKPLDVVAEHEVTTRRLDDLDMLGDIDWIKIDVQGAELMVFEGASRALSTALFVHAEVEFVELYEGQPLFADIDRHLRQAGFQLHTFDRFSQRAFSPLIVGGSLNRGVRQLLWADAIYVRDFLRFEELPDEKLTKLAVIAHDAYESFDLCYRALATLDRRSGSRYCDAYLALLKKTHPKVKITLAKDN